MSFTSVSFLLFLGILIILYYALPKKIQWIVLLIASYAFYLFAGLKYLAFILFTTITTYLVTVYMDSNGDPLRASNVKDGYAIQLASKLGYHLAVISGAVVTNITKRTN